MSHRYKDWEILDQLPEGWMVDYTAGSPAPNTVFITNGKSVLNGQKRALLTVEPKREEFIPKEIITEQEIKNESFAFPAKTVNVLARKKFQEQLLKEILFDLMVCEIEGWDKTEYIIEIKKLINGINLSDKNKANKTGQQDLFR